MWVLCKGAPCMRVPCSGEPYNMGVLCDHKYNQIMEFAVFLVLSVYCLFQLMYFLL